MRTSSNRLDVARPRGAYRSLEKALRSMTPAQVTDEVKQHLGEKVFSTVIPRTVRLAESPSFGKPILLYDKDSRGCQSYLALAEEFLRRRAVGGGERIREAS